MIDVEKLAREAHTAVVTQDYPGHTGQLDSWTMCFLSRFAALVLEAAAREVSLDHGPQFNGQRTPAEIIRAMKPKE